MYLYVSIIIQFHLIVSVTIVAILTKKMIQLFGNFIAICPHVMTLEFSNVTQPRINHYLRKFTHMA